MSLRRSESAQTTTGLRVDGNLVARHPGVDVLAGVLSCSQPVFTFVTVKFIRVPKSAHGTMECIMSAGEPRVIAA